MHCTKKDLMRFFLRKCKICICSVGDLNSTLKSTFLRYSLSQLLKLLGSEKATHIINNLLFQMYTDGHEDQDRSNNTTELENAQDMDKTSNDSTIEKIGNYDVSKMLNNESDNSSDQESDYETATDNKILPPNTLSCVYCQKLFNRIQDLEKHIRMHTGEKPFKCDICDKYFSQKSHRNHHMKVHLGIKSHFCDICDKGFWRKGDLTLHRISDHEDKFTSTEMEEYKKSAGILSCYNCNKPFLRQKDLEKHERVHTGDKPFKCNLCEQFFSQSGQLSLHMKRHLGLKPYPCDICGKAFLQNYLLIIHKRIHTKEKPFSCDVCGMSFYENCKMQAHKRRHTEQPTFSCEFCEKAFFDKERKMLFIMFIYIRLYDLSRRLNFKKIINCN